MTLSALFDIPRVPEVCFCFVGYSFIAKGEIMKKLIALFLFIAMLFSLASCGEPAPEPPATDDTPKDEGFEQGYLFCHEAELCNPWEFTYSERQYDIIAYRSKVKSFDRSTLEDIELEISYGTFPML